VSHFNKSGDAYLMVQIGLGSLFRNPIPDMACILNVRAKELFFYSHNLKISNMNQKKSDIKTMYYLARACYV
jgi:hypothetical protein